MVGAGADRPSRAVIVVAAGSGTRLGGGRPKAFVEVAGRTILEWALRGILGSSAPFQIVLVVPADLVDEARSIAEATAGHVAHLVTVTSGSSTRQSSVARGLARVADTARTVLVHDAARCFTPSSQFDLVASAVESLGHGVVPGLPVSDTIKRVDAAGAVVDTVDRSELVAIQTPQGFPRAELDAAYAGALAGSSPVDAPSVEAVPVEAIPIEYTDDAALFAAAGHEVTVVAGAAEAFKVTTPWDLQRAEMLAADLVAPSALGPTRPADVQRVGIGIDVHGFDADQPLRLGALDWPGEPGLAGHSDGDAVAHAMVDALLSAAGEGDIGSRFGTADPRYAGASGVVFLKGTREILDAVGATVVNVAVQVIGNRPRLAKRRVEMETQLTRILGAPVSVSATTTDGLGFTGRGEGVTVIATALVSVRSTPVETPAVPPA
ncbi:2-C-methyl-D-erythritol 4-phosphate cytidylyltransferase [Frondihabitans sp. Leaf304]|uniref:2-C-methyl-D-erythritol 4-phosphate cytidylyltransferase n=1 Tax=Frondihabitans sp. Leaf304 TaxID=1736329 RepID=UPI0006FA38EA|nr:2-C-methyl-D-erythritol 2,4-cyclodiphosphate synthase [Frondihabitans sp. Leaf304]